MRYLILFLSLVSCGIAPATEKTAEEHNNCIIINKRPLIFKCEFEKATCYVYASFERGGIDCLKRGE